MIALIAINLICQLLLSWISRDGLRLSRALGIKEISKKKVLDFSKKKIERFFSQKWMLL